MMGKVLEVSRYTEFVLSRKLKQKLGLMTNSGIQYSNFRNRFYDTWHLSSCQHVKSGAGHTSGNAPMEQGLGEAGFSTFSK